LLSRRRVGPVGRGIGPLFRRFGPREPGRHQSLFDPRAAAHRTRDEVALRLPVIGSRTREPAFEFVALVADERVSDHCEMTQTTCRYAGFAIGPTISKRRPCCREGIRARAVATAAGSISAITTAGSMSPSASTRPQGSTIIEWPNVLRPF